MGRSNRQTADYFPHYVGEKSRTKFILEKNWGNDGYAFWFKLLELLCAADGQYYDCWDKMSAKAVSHVPDTISKPGISHKLAL